MPFESLTKTHSDEWNKLVISCLKCTFSTVKFIEESVYFFSFNWYLLNIIKMFVFEFLPEWPQDLSFCLRKHISFMKWERFFDCFQDIWRLEMIQWTSLRWSSYLIYFIIISVLEHFIWEMTNMIWKLREVFFYSSHVSIVHVVEILFVLRGYF